MPDAKPPRVVLDNNIFISGTILPTGVGVEILEAWRHGAFTLLSNRAQISELIEVLERPKFALRYSVGSREIASLAHRIEVAAMLLEFLDPPVISLRDPDDELILSIATTGGATYLVTGDDDFHSVAGDPRLGSVQVIGPTAFVEQVLSK